MKKQSKKNNYAFIDGQNLYLAIKSSGWKLDFPKFRTYLKEKHLVEKAYMFMGYLPSNTELYSFLQSSGFVLIFKPILENKGQVIKGNCDAELVLQAMIDYKKYNQAIIVTGDGDFYCLVKYLDDNNKLKVVLAPSNKNCSKLLKQVAKKKIALVSDLKKRLHYTKIKRTS